MGSKAPGARFATSQLCNLGQLVSTCELVRLHEIILNALSS